MTQNERKKEILGEYHATAMHKLRRQLLFKYVTNAGDHYCYQCGKPIENVQEFSIEHKVPWQNNENPVDTFWDIDNIAFSHLTCNIKAGSKTEVSKATKNRFDKFRQEREVRGVGWCTGCKSEVPVSEFSKDRSKPSGLNIRCRPCQKKKRREYYLRSGK